MIQRKEGEEVAQEFTDWLEAVLGKKTMGRDEYREILSRLDFLEKDFSVLKDDVRDLRLEMHERFERMDARVDERFDQMHERFERMDARVNERLGQMEARMDERFDGMYHQMAVQTRWLIGSLALIGAVVSVLLAIGQFIR